MTQGINLPDYFGCEHCPAGKHYHGQLCNEFQAAGRCRADTLRLAIERGAVQIHLHVGPAGLLGG